MEIEYVQLSSIPDSSGDMQTTTFSIELLNHCVCVRVCVFGEVCMQSHEGVIRAK